MALLARETVRLVSEVVRVDELASADWLRGFPNSHAIHDGAVARGEIAGGELVLCSHIRSQRPGLTL